mmetsp:Transcript_33755/g.48876  ORF Transcript_33755/g.48876 Transcript_33755/m.48876 type:complete len:704 (-) Transcript_33755:316-2427(-)
MSTPPYNNNTSGPQLPHTIQQQQQNQNNRGGMMQGGGHGNNNNNNNIGRQMMMQQATNAQSLYNFAGQPLQQQNQPYNTNMYPNNNNTNTSNNTNNTPQQQQQQQQQQQAKVQRRSALPPSTMSAAGGATSNSSVSAASSSTSSSVRPHAAARVSSTHAQLTPEQQARLERERKNQKEKFLMFTKVLMKYLENKDPELHARAKIVIKDCAEKNKAKDPAYKSLTTAMQKRLRECVGEIYWKKADDYLKHFLKTKIEQQKKQRQKEEIERHAAREAEKARLAKMSAHNAQPPSTSSSSAQSKSLSQAEIEHRKNQARKHAYNNSSSTGRTTPIVSSKQQQQQAQAVVSNSAAASNNLKKQTGQGMNPNIGMMMPNIMNPLASKSRGVPNANTSTSNNAQAGSSANRSMMNTSSNKAGSMTPITSSSTSAPPPDIMDQLDNNVRYDHTSAARLLSRENMADSLNLDAQQRILLYGKTDFISRKMPTTASRADQFRGWHVKNIVNARIAFARTKLSCTSGNPAEGSSESEWINEDVAENDPVLTLVSEATQLYVKKMLESAVTSSRKKQNLDGIRLWHLQHGQKQAPLALQLGCDVPRQVALADGQAAKICQRMEQALSRRDVGIELSEIKSTDALHASSSMSELSRTIRVSNASANAEVHAKRSFEVFAGKDGRAPPFGRVPKRCKLLVSDLRGALSGHAFRRFP